MREMAQWVKHFLCKCERRESGSPRTRVKRTIQCHTSVALALGRRRLEHLWASEAKTWELQTGETLSQKIKRRAIRKDE